MAPTASTAGHDEPVDPTEIDITSHAPPTVTTKQKFVCHWNNKVGQDVTIEIVDPHDSGFTGPKKFTIPAPNPDTGASGTYANQAKPHVETRSYEYTVWYGGTSQDPTIIIEH